MSLNLVPISSLMKVPAEARTLESLEAGLLAPQTDANVRTGRSSAHAHYRCLSSILWVSAILSATGFLAAFIRFIIGTEASHVFDGVALTLFVTLLCITLSAIYTLKSLMESSSFRCPSCTQDQRAEVMRLQNLLHLEEEQVPDEGVGGDGASESISERASEESSKTTTGAEKKLLQQGTSNAGSTNMSEVAAAVSEIASEVAKASEETGAEDSVSMDDPSASDLRKRSAVERH